MAFVYMDRAGKIITKEEWKKLRADPKYREIRAYDNGRLRLQLEWLGKIDNYGMVFDEFYKNIRMTGYNYSQDGTLVMDPSTDDLYYHREGKAIEEYEAHLTSWTASSRNAEGEFVEEDNILAAPEAPDMDSPAVEPDIPEIGGAEVGAW